MTLEERVARLERQFDTLDRIDQRLREHGAILTRIETSLQEIVTILPRLGFRWPWETRP